MNRLGKALLLGAFVLAAATGCKRTADPAAIHREKAEEHLGNSEWKPAIDEYALSLEANPKQEKVLEQMAYAHLQLRELDQVEATVQKIADLKTDPMQKADVYRKLANLFVEQGAPDKAEKSFLKTVEIDPKDDVSLAWIAEIYAQRGGTRTQNPAVPALLDKALQYYDKVIALKPDIANTYINKRIAVAKYMEYEDNQKAVADQSAKAEKKDKARAEDLRAKAQQIQAHIDDLKRQYDELTQKFVELQKAAKAKEGQGQPQ